jgi:uncharacterized membrane protein HdeD (DUF308 family)
VLRLFLGIYWLFSGVISIARLMLGKNRATWLAPLLDRILGILAGLVLLAYPLYSAILVPSVLVLALGAFGFYEAFQ